MCKTISSVPLKPNDSYSFLALSLASNRMVFISCSVNHFITELVNILAYPFFLKSGSTYTSPIKLYLRSLKKQYGISSFIKAPAQAITLYRFL